jgi:predicted nucleotidyltransferase
MITYLRECFYGTEATTGRLQRFLKSLNKNGVKYLLLGGWAVGIYGAPRATADMDIFIATDDENIEKLQNALFEFGAPTVSKEHLRHGL